MSPPTTKTAPGSSSFAPILIATVVTLFVGYLTKQGCFALGMGDSIYCYSDYGPVYYARQLGDGGFPYFPPPLEYPAGLGLVLWFASAVTSSGLDFARVSMALSAIGCLATVWFLWRFAGRHDGCPRASARPPSGAATTPGTP